MKQEMGQSGRIETLSTAETQRFRKVADMATAEHCSRDWPQDQQDILSEETTMLLERADTIFSGRWTTVGYEEVIYELGIALVQEAGLKRYESDLFWQVKGKLVKAGCIPRNVLITAIGIMQTGKTPSERRQETEVRIREGRDRLRGISHMKKMPPQDRFPFNRVDLHFSNRRNS